MFLSICKSCFCRWKTRKKAKNQPLIKKKPQKTHQKNPSPPSLWLTCPAQFQLYDKQGENHRISFSQAALTWAVAHPWSLRGGGPKAGVWNAEGACSMWMAVWPQMDLERLVLSPWAHQSLDIGWPSLRKSKRTAPKCSGTSGLQEISKHPGLPVSLGLRISTPAPSLVWPQVWIIAPLAVWFCRS